MTNWMSAYDRVRQFCTSSSSTRRAGQSWPASSRPKSGGNLPALWRSWRHSTRPCAPCSAPVLRRRGGLKNCWSPGGRSPSPSWSLWSPSSTCCPPTVASSPTSQPPQQQRSLSRPRTFSNYLTPGQWRNKWTVPKSIYIPLHLLQEAVYSKFNVYTWYSVTCSELKGLPVGRSAGYWLTPPAGRRSPQNRCT